MLSCTVGLHGVVESIQEHDRAISFVSRFNKLGFDDKLRTYVVGRDVVVIVSRHGSVPQA